MATHKQPGDWELQESITSLVKLLIELRGPERQREVAEAFGISPSSLTHSLSAPGPRHRFWSASDVKRIATYYEISTDALLGDETARTSVLEDLYALALERASGDERQLKERFFSA